jgi:hypothetical protein
MNEKNSCLIIDNPFYCTEKIYVCDRLQEQKTKLGITFENRYSL